MVEIRKIKWVVVSNLLGEVITVGLTPADKVLFMRESPMLIVPYGKHITDEDFAELRARFEESLKHNRVMVLPP